MERGRFAKTPPKKHLLAAVFDFCFGPPAPPVDPLKDEKRIVKYIRSRKGRITASDLVGLTGWPYEKCEQEVTRLLIDYNGEPEVTDDGVIVYVFKELRVTADDDTDVLPARKKVAAAASRPAVVARSAASKPAVGAKPTSNKPKMYWEQNDPKERLTGNTSGQNTLIVVLSLFNLLGGLFLGQYGVQMFMEWYAAQNHLSVHHVMNEYASTAQTATNILVTFPLLFTLSYLAVPAVRSVGVWAREKKRKARNRRRGLVKAIYDTGGAPVPPDELVKRVSGADPTQVPELKAELDKLMVPLEGDVGNDDKSGQVVYKFPRLERELKTAKQARADAAADEAQAGEVVFDTDK
jgi:hypothetical protein